jgi:hypothetical protein
VNDGKETALYRVVKVFDFTTNKACYDTRMCGQAAYALVPSKDAQRLMYSGDELKIQAFNDSHKFSEVWLEQPELDPAVGFPIHFVSVKLGAGWWRSAPVVKLVKYEGVPGFKLPRMVLHTETGLYLLEVGE